MPPRSREPLHLVVDGHDVEVPDLGSSLLEVLRDHLGITSVKDGCAPQGQCGCCTVLVDGQPRVACVTPARRVAGRAITTVEGLDTADRWAAAFCATGASQCGFCTPGIICRLDGLRRRDPDAGHDAVEQALLAHLCRCTGWRTILEAWDRFDDDADPMAGRDRDAAERRAALETGGPQEVGTHVALGRAPFADDTAPEGAIVAVPSADGGWALGDSVGQARRAAGKVQGRRTTRDAVPPLAAPDGDWAAVLRTSWVEPAYLEPDASWSVPGDDPASPRANGGDFGTKRASPAPAAAAELAAREGRAVRALLHREDVVRMGAKRPPVAGGARADGTGLLRVVHTPGVVERIAAVAPGLEVQAVDVAGPPTTVEARAAGWAEAVVLLAGARGRAEPVVDPFGGGRAEAEVDGTGIRVLVDGGDPLDPVVLRSYVVGAAHMALSWLSSEGLFVDEDGTVHDLTIRSFGVLRAVDTPPVEVEVQASPGPPVPVGDAVFAAVAAAAWLHLGCPPDWPTGHRWR